MLNFGGHSGFGSHSALRAMSAYTRNNMQALNLPEYSFKIRREGDRVHIFDPFRKKYIVLSPEEWVRQHLLQFLVQERKFPASLISIETGLKYNQLSKRADILIHDTFGKPHLMVECKAPAVKITQDAFDQIARYNMVFKVKYLVVSNGINHFCCEMDYITNNYSYLKEIPFF
jgi:hypothetical protein